jgi:branched-chain amino acid aminotransferase
VSPVAVISYKDQDLDIPMVRGDSGEYAAMIKSWLVAIMYGKEEHPWGVVVKEVEEL